MSVGVARNVFHPNDDVPILLNNTLFPVMVFRLDILQVTAQALSVDL